MIRFGLLQARDLLQQIGSELWQPHLLFAFKLPRRQPCVVSQL